MDCLGQNLESWKAAYYATLVIAAPLALIAAAWRLWMADQQVKLANKKDEREREERAEQRQKWLAREAEERCARFEKAAALLLEEGSKRERNYDATQAMLEIEAIAEADPSRFLKYAEKVIGTLDRKMRFPSKKDIEEYERINAEEAAHWEKMEADPEYQAWKEDHHRPYKDDEPRIGGLDLSYVYTLKRLVRKWGKIPEKRGEQLDDHEPF